MNLLDTRNYIEELSGWFYSDRIIPLKHGRTVYFAAAYRLKGSRVPEDIKRVKLVDLMLQCIPDNENDEEHLDNLAKYF